MPPRVMRPGQPLEVQEMPLFQFPADFFARPDQQFCSRGADRPEAGLYGRNSPSESSGSKNATNARARAPIAP